MPRCTFSTGGVLIFAGLLSQTIAGKSSDLSETNIVGTPHPTLANRLVTVLDGISIEYSSKHEQHLGSLARQAAERTDNLRRELAGISEEMTAHVPMSATDLAANRAEILARVAREIGFDEPTDLQRRCYDAMLEYYNTTSRLQKGLELVFLRLASQRRFAIWEKQELAGRLKRGEQIEGFTWDEAKHKMNVELSVESTYKPSPEELARIQEAERQRLDHSVNYTTDELHPRSLQVLPMGDGARRHRAVIHRVAHDEHSPRKNSQRPARSDVQPAELDGAPTADHGESAEAR